MAERVAVIGAGPVGATLGGALLKSGFEVKYGSRNPGADKFVQLLKMRTRTRKDHAGEQLTSRSLSARCAENARPISPSVQAFDVLHLQWHTSIQLS